KIIPGKVRPSSRPHTEAHPQVLIIAHTEHSQARQAHHRARIAWRSGCRSRVTGRASTTYSVARRPESSKTRCTRFGHIDPMWQARVLRVPHDSSDENDVFYLT
ncbi:hypothetical protein E2F47_16865, partial [Mycobacterium eburneum]